MYYSFINEIINGKKLRNHLYLHLSQVVENIKVYQQFFFLFFRNTPFKRLVIYNTLQQCIESLKMVILWYFCKNRSVTFIKFNGKG